MKTFNVYLCAWWNFKESKLMYEVHVCLDTSKQSETRFKLLFSIPEKWIPETTEDFLKACAHFHVPIPVDTVYFGYVPF